MDQSFLSKFDELMREATGNLGQCPLEWREFLWYVAMYFKARVIDHPVVVEIGVWRNAQKRFYEELLGAEHIGIDIDVRAHPDIWGDSLASRVIEELKARLAGRMVDLLFIDGHHSYKGVKGDYEAYAPLTRHIVAIHDILSEGHPEVDVNRFWKELCANDRDNLHIVIHKLRAHERGTPWDGFEMGIGLVVKE